MDMDGNASDHSLPSSDHTGGTWIQSWEKDIHSVSRLNLESNNELNGLVEDKEIAARAVALVVNSSRKGIVPLCADVANLLRAKKSLEKDILLLKQQNNVLHSSSASMHTSHSTSPTPTSLNSYQDGSTLNDPNNQERSRPCSRCSQSSSVLSNSPKTDKLRGHKLSGYSYPPNHNNNNHNNNNNNNNNNNSSDVNSITPVINKLADSPTSPNRFRASKYATTQPNSSTESSPKTLHNGITTQAIIHHPPDSRPNSADLPPESPTSLCDVPADVCSLTESSSSDRPSEELTDDCQKRKDSLPEIVSKPIPHLPKSNATVSKEVQCLLSPSIEDEDKISDSKSSRKLAESLADALQEIEVLKRKIKELETNQLACQSAEQHSFIVTPLPTAVQIVQPIPTVSFPTKDCQEESDMMIMKGRVKEQVKIFGRQCSPLQSQQDLTSTPNLVNGSRKTCPAVPKKPVRNPFACPLPLCKCEPCTQAVATAGSDGRLPSTDQLIRSYPVSPTLHVRLNDHIVVRGNRTGHIHYIGHLDKMGSANTVFIGLELDAPVGVNDGFFSGKRYFECPKEYGLFVTFNDVVCLVKKVSSIKQAFGISVPSKENSELICKSGADILDQFSCRNTKVKNDSHEVEIEEQVAIISESIRL